MDLNSIVSSAFNAAVKDAVDAHMLQLAEQVDQMQKRVMDVVQRVESISASFTTEVGRMENAGTPDVEELLKFLDDREWFWEKIQRFVRNETDSARALTAEDLDKVMTPGYLKPRLRAVFNDMDLAEHLDWTDNVESALENIDLKKQLDVEEIVEKVLENIDMDDLAEKVKDDLDMDDVAEKVVEDLDLSELAEQVKEELDVGDIVKKVKEELDGQWIAEQLNNMSVTFRA